MKRKKENMRSITKYIKVKIDQTAQNAKYRLQVRGFKFTNISEYYELHKSTKIDTNKQECKRLQYANIMHKYKHKTKKVKCFDI